MVKIFVGMCCCVRSHNAPGLQDNPSQGFYISTQVVTAPTPTAAGIKTPISNSVVLGEVDSGFQGQSGISGTVGSYDGLTNAAGLSYVSNAIAPWFWNNWVWLPSSCDIPTTFGLSYVQTNFLTGQTEWEYYSMMPNNGKNPNAPALEWDCIDLTSSLPAASQRFAFAGDIPSSVTLSASSPFSSEYGMPVIYVYSGANGNPSLYNSITASSVDPSGASATFPLPATLPQNAYAFETQNQNGGGSSTMNSVNFFSVASSQTIAGNPFGVSVGAQTDTYEDCDPCLGGPKSNQCSTGSSYSTFPVISLYSKNQVLVGGTAVSVGANPTAVATYPANAVTQTATGSCEENKNTYSGNTRAVVANSGDNTVSVLDIVNNALLFNVTVGNQPVALAVSSDGSTAYVANYKDSTVTKVNLSTGTAATTVAVGGKPTSVALTSAGILWVGGVGFLTEINTATMGVTATETASGKTIIALGYSDSVGQLVATTVDGSGNVYADEINPATVTTGGTYTPLASNTVSSLGTHLDTQTEADVRSFTGTLASESIINTNQVGAPPLVVQDGWAVVTATPTGFTITDITGQDVLVSETTPSPVTAIAADPNLNVVYLTMPDSNILLTVPLPGTGTN